jgi:hypothetical protein
MIAELKATDRSDLSIDQKASVPAVVTYGSPKICAPALMTGAASLHFDRSCPEMLVRAWLASFNKHSRWLPLAIAAGGFILDTSEMD